MRRSWRYLLLCSPFVVVAFLMVPFGKRQAVPVPPSLPLDRWDIPQLAAYLNEAGVVLHTKSVQKNGKLGQRAFLTVDMKDWEELNRLTKDATQIARWRGIVYCERPRLIDVAGLMQQWGDGCLAVEPFIFYGDTDLLARIKAALTPPARTDAP